MGRVIGHLALCVLVLSGLGMAAEDDSMPPVELCREMGELSDELAQIQGVPQDYARIVECYRKAAERGNTEAQIELGTIYLLGDSFGHRQGVQQSDSEAVKWYRKAAEQGNVEAQWSLGEMYKLGRPAQQTPLRS